MTSNNDNLTNAKTSAPIEPEQASLKVAKNWQLQGRPLLADSTSKLSYRQSNSPLSNLFASTSSIPKSRSDSPDGKRTSSRSRINGLILDEHSSRRSSSEDRSRANIDRIRQIIAQSFAPTIAVSASADAEELVRDKGIDGGLSALLKPYGETVQGKVTTRDSIGASRNWENFGVHFSNLDNIISAGRGHVTKENTPNSLSRSSLATPGGRLSEEAVAEEGGVRSIENLLDRHLWYAETLGHAAPPNIANEIAAHSVDDVTDSPFYDLYLRRVLSGSAPSPHETFLHPVACVIAVSSRNPSPVEALRELYDDTYRGARQLPPWANNDYLRYYLLVHDEEHDDIGKSSAILEQMKRGFGLNCHLLRLRSTHSVATDDDVSRLPPASWISAEEELDMIQSRETKEDLEDPTPYLFESDVGAIKVFIREMVTQSVVPFMERCVTTWNDQVASRRRGISGRFMTFSKKWTGLGSSSRTVSGGSGGPSSSSSGSNYDAQADFYRPDSPEATLRRLADFAFMLRDWKLAQGVYDLVKSDYSNDKAWRYHAGAHEMSAIGSLLLASANLSKASLDSVDATLETAFYSYLKRCGDSYNTLRCLLLAVDLYRAGGKYSTEHAAQWAMRIIEADLVGHLGTALVTEQVAACFGSKYADEHGQWKSRRRKASFWSILAANSWYEMEMFAQADKCLKLALFSFGGVPNTVSKPAFESAIGYIENFQRSLRAATASKRGEAGLEPVVDEEPQVDVDEEHENLGRRAHRYSMLGQMDASSMGFHGEPLNTTNQLNRETL